MLVDEKPTIIHPISLIEKEEGDEIVTDKENIELSKIWMMTQVPSYIKPISSDPSDSDIQ